jgi:excisionase family DNA binding protein
MALITTKDAAIKLKLSVRRVQEFVKEGRLPAQLIGGVYLIDHRDLAKVKKRPTGRPPKKTER